MLAAQPSFERCSSGLMVPNTWGPGTEETAAASLSESSRSYRETDTLLASERASASQIVGDAKTETQQVAYGACDEAGRGS